MKALRALVPLIRHRRGQVVLIGMLHALAAVLSLFTFLSVVPFLRILFGTSAPEAVGDGAGVLGAVSRWFDLWVQTHGASQALVGLCLTMVVLALLKNAVQYAALYVMAGTG